MQRETPMACTGKRERAWSHLMGAGTLMNEEVYNRQNEKLGEIKEFMLDMNTGKDMADCSWVTGVESFYGSARASSTGYH